MSKTKILFERMFEIMILYNFLETVETFLEVKRKAFGREIRFFFALITCHIFNRWNFSNVSMLKRPKLHNLRIYNFFKIIRDSCLMAGPFSRA
jgi:hypothetical protein